MFERRRAVCRVWRLSCPPRRAAHAIRVAMDEAHQVPGDRARQKTILFGLTGTGYFDMYAYDAYNNGRMTDHIPTDEELEAGFATIPSIPGVQIGESNLQSAPSGQNGRLFWPQWVLKRSMRLLSIVTQ